MINDQPTEDNDADAWAEGFVRAGVKAPRAVVSVSFAREDFERVTAFARRHGMKTSELIRRAALERVAPQGPEPQGPEPGAVVVSGSVFTAHPAIERPRPKIEVATRATVSADTAEAAKVTSG